MKTTKPHADIKKKKWSIVAVPQKKQKKKKTLYILGRNISVFFQFSKILSLIIVGIHTNTTILAAVNGAF